MGTSYFTGNSTSELVKVDIYYTDPFIRSITEEDGIRMAREEEIIAMKLDVVGHGGRKKDFWDLHLVHDRYSISTMIQLYHERYPYSYREKEIRAGSN